MRALTRAASLLPRAAGSAPTTAALHHPPPGPGVGPCLLKLQTFWKHSLTGKEEHSFLTLEDHNRAIHQLKMTHMKEIDDLENKLNKSVLEHKSSMNLALMQLKCDLKKDADNKLDKHFLEHAVAKNELKILGRKFESHKLTIKNIYVQGFIAELRHYGWGIGIASAVFRFLDFSKFFNKTDGKVE